MSNTVNAKLYKIHDSIVIEKADNVTLIKEIVQSYKNKSGNEFINIELSENTLFDGWSSKLYVFSTDNKIPDWYKFLLSIVEDKNDINGIQNKFSSFLLFIYKDTSMFAISKGYYGHFLLDDHIDSFFGMDVLSRLVNKSTTEIKQIEERAVFGSEIGAQRFFRDNYNLAFDDDFGKMYKAMLASIEEEDFQRLGILKKRASTKKLSITGSSSLEISSKFSYKELVGRIIKIQEILDNDDSIEFNQFYRLPAAMLKPIRSQLNENLLILAYERYLTNEKIDFYHPQIFSYLQSVETQFINEDGLVEDVGYCYSLGYNQIINMLVDRGFIDVTDEETFIESLQRVKARFKVTEDGFYTSEITIDNWFCGEVQHNNNKYFKLDNHWYLYRDSLDESLIGFFENYNFGAIGAENVLPDWTQENEAAYNESFLNAEGFIVTDRTYLNNIEIADIIKITDNDIFFYHVKNGLGQDTRVLINQIINAARYITYYRDEENNLALKSYYNRIINKYYDENGITVLKDGILEIISESDFVQLFKSNRKYNFVFVYGSNSDKTIKEEIQNTKSRIAKLSLVYAIRDLRRTDFSFLIERVYKD
ncbi:DUF6119 family protein [Flavobacterium coralii]|uniref:DUF6119 family protein n=1 Tax=Flavobacterium coralii TaxID=2838017 RepID=UPI000C5AB75B|nr:hypothetical protein [Flavobacterium sp.]|tara:strand:- start:5266 stop:7041 length:1776 start_codon:yes stop_codon:yes gene_type:complete